MGGGGGGGGGEFTFVVPFVCVYMCLGIISKKGTTTCKTKRLPGFKIKSEITFVAKLELSLLTKGNIIGHFVRIHTMV